MQLKCFLLTYWTTFQVKTGTLLTCPCYSFHLNKPNQPWHSKETCSSCVRDMWSKYRAENVRYYADIAQKNCPDIIHISHIKTVRCCLNIAQHSVRYWPYIARSVPSEILAKYRAAHSEISPFIYRTSSVLTTWNLIPTRFSSAFQDQRVTNNIFDHELFFHF